MFNNLGEGGAISNTAPPTPSSKTSKYPSLNKKLSWSSHSNFFSRAALGCKTLSAPPFGHIKKFYAGALVGVSCNPGYELIGSAKLYCDALNWNASMPTCLPKSSSPPVTCTFEEPDICGWSQGERNDHFDWTRYRLSTLSGNVGTGPSYDHTFQSKNNTVLGGYYMYIESSTPRKRGDMAFLYSPVFPASYSTTYQCFSFWYHMYGQTTGE
ncbi:MAM and LDL-receptor class A domain-containing protein 1 [Nymphon striatum]|nr:MAM and LDL-receptor class A domain-containing protein 1 [Nymphon striatum]